MGGLSKVNQARSKYKHLCGPLLIYRSKRLSFRGRTWVSVTQLKTWASETDWLWDRFKLMMCRNVFMTNIWRKSCLVVTMCVQLKMKFFELHLGRHPYFTLGDSSDLMLITRKLGLCSCELFMALNCQIFCNALKQCKMLYLKSLAGKK